MKKALFVVCFLASMVYGLERGATSNFKYIIDTGVFNQSMFLTVTCRFSLFLTFLIRKEMRRMTLWDATTTAIWVR